MPGIILQPKTKEILIKSKNAKAPKVFCEIFAYQPENIEEMQLGSLYMVGRLEDSSQTSSHIISLIISTIKREYYYQPKRKPSKCFEDSLKKANAVLNDLAKTGKIDWLSKLNLACLAVAGEYLYLTQVGKTKILLLRDKRLTDIGRKLVPAQEKVHPQKVFQSIASGKLFNNDKIIIVTADIFKYISLRGFKQIIEFDQIDQLEKVLTKDKEFSTQGMIIISLSAQEKHWQNQKEPITVAPQPALTIPTSLPKYNRFISIKEKVVNFTADLNLILRSVVFKLKDELIFLKEKSKLLKEKFSVKKIKKFFVPLPKKEEVELAEIDTHSLFPEQKITLPQKPARLFRDIEQPAIEPSVKLEPTPVKVLNKKEKVLHSPEAQKAKILLSKITAQITAALSRLSFIRQKLSEIAKKIFFQRKIYLPKDKKPQKKWILPLALILGCSIIILISYFYWQKYKKDIAYYENIIEQEAQKLEAINKIVNLKSPEVLIDFAAAGQNFSPEHLLITKDNLLAIDSGNNSICLISLTQEDKACKFIETSLSKENEWIKAAIFKEDSVILLDKNKELYRYDFSNNKYSLLSLVLSFEKVIIKDFVVYNDALYLLDIYNNQIIKCPNLTNCRAWLKETDNLSNAVSLAIDGSIYVLKSDASISKYFAGLKKETFPLKIRPAEFEINKIMTDKDFRNIYLLDTKAKRIIVADKNGKLIKQITSNAFSDLKDFEITDDEKALFISSGTKIHKIEL